MVSCGTLGANEVPLEPRPRLQIISGGLQSVDVFWLKQHAAHLHAGPNALRKD
jgi:hypothetical protein